MAEAGASPSRSLPCESWARTVCSTCAFISLVIGGSFLAAWLSGYMAQRGLSAITIKTNTALALLLAGISLASLAFGRGTFYRAVGRICASLTLAIGLLTFVENVSNLDLHIDELLAREPAGAVGVTAPNRMGVPASLSFSLAGAALLLQSRRDRRWGKVAQSCALAVCLIAMLAIVGYLYDVRELYGLARLTAIAWPTSVGMLVLGIGILAARCDGGITALITADDPGGDVSRRLLIPAVLLPILLGWGRLMAERHGFYETELGTAFLVIGFVIIFGALALDAGARLSRSAAVERAARQSLQLSESRFRATYEHAAVGIETLDLDGRFLHGNGMLQRLLGYTEAELHQLTFVQITHPQDYPREKPLLADLLAGRTSFYSIEKRYLRKDGVPVWVRVTSSLARADRVYRISLIEDITERKRAEAELEAARHSAEQAKVAAEQANLAKDHFLAVLSHELRTPLTPVLAATDLLDRDPNLPPAARDDLATIRRNVEMEARLIDDLLDVTRIARGKVQLDRRPVAVGEIIHRAVEVCRPDIDARGQHVGVNLNGCADRTVLADPARLQQVFWNLIKNAIKFTPHGGCIGVRCTTDDGQLVTEVIDSGEGIEPDILPRLFNAFEQGASRTARQFGGLGLGLAITRGLVELHGGSISAHSDGKECGAVFRVRLPIHHNGAESLTPPEAAARPSAKTEHASSAAAPQTCPPMRILLVEDHADTARLMRRLLVADGHSVEVAADVASAIALTKPAGRFDLLISDLGLPDGSGLELLRKLRSQGDLIPAIALSGYGQENDIRRSLDAGFTEHLTKPTNPDRLAQAIASVSRQPRQ